MPFICECGSETFYTHTDEEITVTYDGDGNEIDGGEIHSIQQTHNWPYKCVNCEKEYSQLPPLKPEEEWLRDKERKYLEDTVHCPICKSDNIDGGSLEVNDTSVSQYVTCHNCDAEWTDIYHLKHVEINSYPTPTDLTPAKTETPDPNKAFRGNK